LFNESICQTEKIPNNRPKMPIISEMLFMFNTIAKAL
jgi:hypothetical protein